MLDNDKYQEYFDQYSDYSSKYLLGNKYCSLGKKITKTKYYQILYYKTLVSQDCIISKKRIFLVIPSIFNSPEILFLAKSKSFVDNLRHCGEVFLVDWFEVDEADYLLEDYVKRVVEIISKIISNLRQKKYQIDLVGHCIGGIIGMAATIIVPNMIRTLTLLSTPWDFSHFATARNIYQYLGLDYYVRNLPMIPKLHIQILFFLLMPNYFSTKLDKFFTITVPKIRDLSFRVENWLMSGTALSRNTYIQIMDDVVGNNMLAKLQWKVSNITIDPTLINKPVYQIIASNDKIVPKSSMLSLHKLFRESMIFEVPSGHISYLINNNLDILFKEYTRRTSRIGFVVSKDIRCSVTHVRYAARLCYCLALLEVIYSSALKSCFLKISWIRMRDYTICTLRLLTIRFQIQFFKSFEYTIVYQLIKIIECGVYSMSKKAVYITHAKRTAVGSLLGSLGSIPATKLAAIIIESILKDSKLDPAIINEVIMGQVITGGVGQNPARQALIQAGLPKEVTGFTVNKVCGSGLKTVCLAASSIIAGDNDIVIAGGQENMSLGLHGSYIRAGHKLGSTQMVDLMQYDGLTDVFSNNLMGITAENISKRFNITREMQDEFALKSHQKAREAQAEGRFKDEILPVEVKMQKATLIFDQDEGIRADIKLEVLGSVDKNYS